jgi:peptidyl-prolyl cis-trans isomerase C
LKTAPGVAATSDGSLISKWLREPLVIFVMIGALLFAVDAWRNDTPAPASDRQSVIMEDDLTRMAAALRNLLEVKVREEVLYREALAMGLDINDTIVKRRMAQKNGIPR